jgi:hypothetical protein
LSLGHISNFASCSGGSVRIHSTCVIISSPSVFELRPSAGRPAVGWPVSLGKMGECRASASRPAEDRGLVCSVRLGHRPGRLRQHAAHHAALRRPRHGPSATLCREASCCRLVSRRKKYGSDGGQAARQKVAGWCIAAWVGVSGPLPDVRRDWPAGTRQERKPRVGESRSPPGRRPEL